MRMKGFHLKQSELNALHKAHKEEGNKRYAYRIHAVILLGTGYTLRKVKEVLFLDEETLRAYVSNYRIDGIAGLLSDNRSGKASKLSDDQIDTLKLEIDTNLYLDTISVINYIKKSFGINYSRSGIRDLLHRIGYVYKKPKLVPGNPDIDAQEIFAEQYEDFMLSKSDDVEVVFVDAVHPQHNAIAGYGWIKRGETRELKTNSGRQRLNLHGAINAETHEITIIESDTVNSDSTIDLLTALEKKYPAASSIKVILDNARYHYSNLVKEYLSESRIDLVFLPSYSPNLNLIERLWGFFKKEVLYNKYYENIKKFRDACIKFFRNINVHADKISNFMNADFHIA
jgi:transposase